MEKPFGTDLASAVALNAKLHEVFAEEQIFRIDHFLGKEPAQNILAFRFANGLFEPIWNRNFIDHVQIDVPETLGLGKRSAFYESTGAYRDMVVTHLFQILGFMAMEPPTHLAPKPISEEKNKVFRSMLPIQPTDVVRGQYIGYRGEEGVAPESDTETFIALKCSIDNWRWAGVPFYLRTGKRLAEGQRIISIAFREPPKSMFPEGSGIGAHGPDHLTFDLADAAKTSLSFYGKRPGPGMRLDKHSLQFAMNDTGQIGDVLEAYERLILDAMRGDHTLFTTAEGIERLWEVSVPLLESPPPVRTYSPGSWGPNAIHQLDRAACLAPAVRAHLARPEQARQLAPLRGCEQDPRFQSSARKWRGYVTYLLRNRAVMHRGDLSRAIRGSPAAYGARYRRGISEQGRGPQGGPDPSLSGRPDIGSAHCAHRQGFSHQVEAGAGDSRDEACWRSPNPPASTIC